MIARWPVAGDSSHPYRGNTMIRLLMLAVCTAALTSAEGIALSLAFSVDDGKTWSAEPPMVAEPRPVQVRFRWRLDTPVEGRDVLYPVIARAGADFPSANRGSPPWEGGRRWIQCPVPSYVFPSRDEVVVVLDPRARPEGASGSDNRWDDAQKRFVAGPLPACAALGNGAYPFSAEIGYRSTTTGQMVATAVPFVLTIGAVSPQAVAAAAASLLPDMRAVLPRDQTPADAALPAEALRASFGGTLRRQSGLATGAVAAWTVGADQAGEWYPTLEVTVGDNLGWNLQSYTPWLYLNGRGIAFATAGTPWVVDGVGAVVELRPTAPVRLAPGDELRLAPGAVERRWVGNLGLHRARPAAGLLDVYPFLPVDDEDRWRARAEIAIASDPAQPSMARLRVVGAGGTERRATARWQILDYFNVAVAEGEAPLALASGQTWTREVPFPWGASDRYRVVLSVDEPGWRSVQTVGEAVADARWSDLRARRWLTAWRFLGRGDGSTGMDAPPGDDAAWIDVRLPTAWQDKGGTQRSGWLVRTVDAAGLPAGRRVLRCSRLAGESTVWVDGVRIAAHAGLAPFEVDLGAALAAPGPHRLAIAMSQGEVTAWAADAVRYAAEITLEARPAAAIDAVRVIPSVRWHRLGLEVAASGAPAGSRVRATVSHRGRQVLAVPAADLVDGRAALSAPWADPVLWDLGRPELLRIDVELVDGRGAVLDRAPVRSGFKEMWADGAQLLLNGTPVKLRATAMDATGSTDAALDRSAIRERIRTAIRYGSQLRQHCNHWDTGLDACDEEGILTCTYAAWSPPHGQRWLDDEAMWAGLGRAAAENVRALANHPSVGIWKLSNEFAETASDPALAIRRLQALGDGVRQADPTRPSQAACDLDMRGWNPIASTHYPVDVGAYQAPASYLPGAALWRPEGSAFVPGMAVPAGQFRNVANVKNVSPLTWGVKPITVDESGWNMFFGPPGGFAALIGDAAYRGSVMLDVAHQRMNAWVMAGHRDAGAALITPWVQPFWGGCLTAVPSVDAWPWTRHACWYAGEAVRWELDLHHDRRAPAFARLHWSLAAEDGRRLDGGGEDLELAPAELRRTAIAFTAPAVAAPTRAVLTITLRTADGQGEPRAFPVEIHPRSKPSFPAAQVALFDPSGATADALARLGWTPPRVARPDAAALAGLALLVIGEDAGADPALIAAGEAVQAFVAHGGAVLALRQQAIDPAWAGTRFQVTAKRTSMAFIRAPHHPVLAGLTDADLQFWFPDHLVSAGDLLKPTAGDFTALTDTALGRAGQDYVQLLDWRVGDGRYVFCQFALAPRLGRQPVADLLLQRLAGWAAADRHGHRPAVVAAEPGSPVHRALRAAGLVIATGDDPSAPLVIDAGQAPSGERLAAWKVRLSAGGRVLVHGVAAANAGWVSELVGRRVAPVRNLMGDWRGRALRAADHPLLDGIANADLFWRRNSAWESLSATFCVDDGMLDRLYDTVLSVDGGQALTYPPVLVAVPVGAGTALLDSTRWESEEVLVAPMARRLAATLCANLGARLESRRTRTWMADLEPVTVDLSPYANRGLADDKADDGAGGFSDQGPDCDLRAWPTGRQVRRGIPFLVHPQRSCIVLASKFRQGQQPESVAIPVGRPVRALFFLQTSAWTGGQLGSYVIRYADGSQVEVPLTARINLMDWQGTYGDEISPEETDTFTRCAGSVPVKASPSGTGSAFVMQWVNPEPAKPVAEVVFASRRQGVLVLMGLTLGVDPPPVDTTPGDRAAAEALRLSAKALEPAAAAAQLLRALAADPSHDAVRLDLAAVQAKAGDAEAAERTLRAALRARVELLQGYADLARLLEGQGRWVEAAEVWKRSLAANPNQPEVYHALENANRKAKE